MPYLTVAVAILALLTAFNLLLLLGVVRRLRDHTGRFAAMTRSVMPDIPVLAAGRKAPAVDQLPPGETLVGFFSPSCGPCKALAPRFAAYAHNFRGEVLVVVAEDADPADYLTLFSPVARVVVEEPGGPVAAAFEVEGFPALCLIGADQTVVASGMRMEDLPAQRTLVANG